MARRSYLGSSQLEVNPYIALSDLMINMVMCFVFLSASMTVVGRLGSDDIKYKRQRRIISEQIQSNVPKGLAPTWITWKNDVAGVQRWVFPGKTLFEGNSSALTAEGREVLLDFAKVLNDQQDLWARVRIEGHSLPPLAGTNDDFTDSALRATSVARVLTGQGRIKANYLVVSGKGGQDALYPKSSSGAVDQRNKRVEIIIEFGRQPASP